MWRQVGGFGGGSEISAGCLNRWRGETGKEMGGVVGEGRASELSAVSTRECI